MFIVEIIIGLGILAAVGYVLYNMLNKTEHTVTAAVQKVAAAPKTEKKTTAKPKAAKPAAAKPVATKPVKEKKPKAASKA